MRDVHENGTWLCPTPFDRTRLLDMEARLLRARTIMYGSVAVGTVLSAPWLGWWTLAPLGVLVLFSLLMQPRIATSGRPEYYVAAVILAAQLMIGLAVALTGGAASPVLMLLMLPVATLPARFNARGVQAGVVSTLVIMGGASLLAGPSGLGDGPHYLIIAAATMIGLAACCQVLMSAEAEQRSTSVLDPLTGLLNRKALDAHFAEIRRQAHYTGRTVSMVVCDLDHFKAINDGYGHQRGDAVLREVAEALRGHLRTFELVYRVGGEEFLILLPGVQASDAEMVARRVREGIAEARPADIELTASLGVAVAVGTAVDFEALFGAADEALYRAKDAGRDRVEVAPALEPSEAAAQTHPSRVAEGPSRVPSIPLGMPLTDGR
jgi:diguanylate cyclase (GGDEF)-like protein